MRIIAIDPGEKHLGVAISDPTGIIANPLTILNHVARMVDAAAIAQLGEEHQVELILVGQALDDEGQPTSQSRRATRLAEAIRLQTNLPVKMWDESGSTQAARQARLAMGVSRRSRRGHMDDLAATVTLQSYLDTNQEGHTP